MRAWLEKCDTMHHHLPGSRSPGPRVVPARLLHLDCDSNTTKVHLSTPVEWPDRYIALSPCWGRKDFAKTTKANLRSFETSIDEQDLPKTFRDVLICARNLCVDYVWIDSLCIVQDDQQDWERESAKMSDIYSKAYLVVVADSAPCAAAGFLNPRPLHYAGLALEFQDENEKHNFIARTPLQHKLGPTASRAWCLQETMLARRCIFFTQEEMIWRCGAEIECECGLHSPPPSQDTNVKWFKDPASGTLYLDSEVRDLYQTNHWATYSGWASLVIENFTRRSLTHATDRLPALSGCASLFGRQGHGNRTYVAGMWLEDMPLGLLWYTIKISSGPLPPEPMDYLGPSFSWVSVNHAVNYASALFNPSERKSIDIMPLTVHDAWCSVPGQNPFGQVVDAYIRLSCSMMAGVLEHAVLEDGSSAFHIVFSSTFKPRTANVYFHPDTQLTDEIIHGEYSAARSRKALASDDEKRCWQAPVDIILVTRVCRHSGHQVFTLLVLGLAPTREDAYARLGLLSILTDEEDPTVPVWLDGFTQRDITIV